MFSKKLTIILIVIAEKIIINTDYYLNKYHYSHMR